MNTRDLLVIGGVAAAIGVGLWWMERPAAAATAPAGPVTTLVTGGRYQLTGSTVTGTPVDPSTASNIQNSLTAGGQWQNVVFTTSGSTYTIQGTYTGPTGAPTPSLFGTVTKIG
jgi:hypothetical protein